MAARGGTAAARALMSRCQTLARAGEAAGCSSLGAAAASPLQRADRNSSCKTPRNSAAWCRPSFPFSSAAAAYAESHTSDVVDTWSASGVSPGVQRIYQELTESMDKRCIPQSSLIPSLLQECTSPSDIRLGLRAIERLRKTRAVLGQQQQNFSKDLSCRVVDACLRTNDTGDALKVLWTNNTYGFTPSVEAANQILAYAKEQRSLPLMKKTLEAMNRNSLTACRATADIVVRICKESGDESLMMELAKGFHRNRLTFRPALYDVCISTAANAGEFKHVLEVQRWMSSLKLPQTTASAFALSKARLLQGESKEAAQIINSYVKESEERDMYLRVLVRAWPVEVLSRKRRSLKEIPLRTAVEKMLEELKAQGYRGKVPSAEEFGTGKESIAKVVYD